MLSELPGVTCLEPQGAFYCFPDVTSLLGRPLGPAGLVAANTLELADLALSDANVAFVPGEAFGTPGYIRLSFAMGDDDIAEGIRRLSAFTSTP